MKRRLLGAGLLAALSLFTGMPLSTAPAHAYIADSFGIAPRWKWREIETDHFRITFPEEMAEVAQKAAGHFEDAHRILSPQLRWEPGRKTQVLLYDNSDAANGLAAAVLRLGVILYITPPEPWFSTSYYDDWLRLVVFHEYTHFLNMDPTRGIWSPLRFLFGDTLLPNATWPTWMLEGLAVWNETRYTRTGRGRSPYWRAVLRAAVEENLLGDPSLVSLDLLNADTFEFPDGEIPYLYGYEMMNQVVQSAPTGAFRTHDDETPVQEREELLGILSERSSRRIPYFIEGNSENVTGKTWSRHWRDWVADTRKRMSADLEAIRSTGEPDAYRTEATNFDSLRGLRISRDGNWATWINEGSDRRTGIHLRNRKDGQELRIGDQLLGGGSAFTPDSKALVFAGAHRQGSFFLFDDISVYELDSRRLTRLSRGLRARDPDVSPDGNSIVFAGSDARGAVALFRASLSRSPQGEWQLGTAELLHHPGLLGRVSNPRFSPDGGKVLFSEHINGKAQEDLLEFDLSSRNLRPVVQDGFFNRMPVYHPVTGEPHYISNRTGVETLWKIDSAGTAQQVLQVTTGLWFPEISPEGEIHAARVAARGWDWVAYPPKAPSTVAAPALAPPPAPGPARPAELPDAPESALARTFKAERYAPWPSLLPRQWSPYLGSSADNFFAGLSTFGFDATDRHSYLATAEWSSLTEFSYDITYENRLLGATLAVHPSSTVSGSAYSYDSDHDTYDYIFRRTNSLELQAYWPYQLTWSTLTPIVSGSLYREQIYRKDGLPSSDQLGPTSQVSSSAPSVYLEGRLNYDDTESAALAISSERGGISSFGFRGVSSPGESPAWKLGAFHRHFFAFGLSHHVLVPEVVTAWSLQPRSGATSLSDVVLFGGSSSSSSLLDSLLPTGPGGSNPLSSISIRGYPDNSYIARGAVQTSLDYRFPIFRLFRGYQTLPWVFRNLSGELFAENTWGLLRNGGSLSVLPLPSTGGGLLLTTKAFIRVPVLFSVQYQIGLNESAGGRGNLVTAISIGSLL